MLYTTAVRERGEPTQDGIAGTGLGVMGIAGGEGGGNPGMKCIISLQAGAGSGAAARGEVRGKWGHGWVGWTVSEKAGF